MKIRTGFVSNSSSSSFIIRVPKKKDPCPTCGHVEEGILGMFPKPNDYDSDSSVICTGKENVLVEIAEYGFCDKEAKKIRTAIEKCDDDVAMVSIDYGDETLLRLVENEKYLIYSIG